MISTLKSAGRRVGLDYVYHVLYRVPKSTLQKSIREGGPYHQWRTEQGRLEMKASAPSLPSLSPKPDDPDGPLKIYFLTGKDFWYQSLFCYYSLQQHTDVQVTPVFYDDGSLRQADCATIRKVVPWAEFIFRDAIENRLDEYLPADRYPTLRHRRIEYVHLRKLTDFHAGSTGPKLILDSDMLFFDTPKVVLDWLRNPTEAFHMVDCTETYGYSRELMESLTGVPIPKRLNVGFAGLHSDAIDWDELEYWIRRTQPVCHPPPLCCRVQACLLSARLAARFPAWMTRDHCPFLLLCPLSSLCRTPFHWPDVPGRRRATPDLALCGTVTHPQRLATSAFRPPQRSALRLPR